MMKNHKQTIKVVLTLAVIFGLVFNFSGSSVKAQDTIDELNQEIEQAKEKLEELKKESAVYQKNIRLKQEESISLQNQLDILENQMAKTLLDIEATQEEIKKTELEIRSIELQVLEQEEKMDRRQLELQEIVKNIYEQENSSVLEIFVLNDSMSDFFANLENSRTLSDNLNKSLANLKILKQKLLEEKENLDKKREELVKLSQQLALDKEQMDAEIKYKEELLAETQNSENKFYNLFWQSKSEQEVANNSIYNLEKQMREKLSQAKNDQPALTDSTIIWPVPKNKITAYFHDPTYPFRYLFEHPGVDVRAAQGTTLKAAADGYVLTAKDAGMGYSYIAILHADGLSTVYGHVSKIYVKVDEYVAKGEVIGLTGGMPGTPGAGRLCTGPHLHFEVRLNGIPVDPLLYLP